MQRLKSPFSWFILAVLVTAGLTALGPQEGSTAVLNWAWLLAAEAAFLLAGLAGLPGILLRRERLQSWSAALGRSGTFFWITGLPLTVWAMQADWTGLFRSEPGFRLAVVFAAAGVVLQVGLTLLARPAFTCLFNVLFLAALQISLRRAGDLLPAPFPFPDTGSPALPFFRAGLLFLTLAAAYFMTRWWLQRRG